MISTCQGGDGDSPGYPLSDSSMAVISGEALRMGSFTAGYLHLSASGLQHWSGRGQGRAVRRARTSLDRIPANAVFEIEEGEGTSCTGKLARLIEIDFVSGAFASQQWSLLGAEPDIHLRSQALSPSPKSEFGFICRPRNNWM